MQKRVYKAKSIRNGERFSRRKRKIQGRKNNNAATFKNCILLRNLIRKREGFSRRKKKFGC